MSRSGSLEIMPHHASRPRTQRNLLFLATALLVMGCGSHGVDDTGPDGDARRAVLAALGSEVVLPTYRDFADLAEALELATATYAGSLDPLDLAAAQQAWTDAMDVWQRAELLRFGPAALASGADHTALGGQGLRDEIYSFPAVSPCRVDVELTEGSYADPATLALELVNARGLDAIEYLLWSVGTTDNVCPLNSAINTDGSWDLLVGSGNLEQARADYAESAAILVRQAADALVDAWEPAGGNFVAELGTAGLDGTVYETSREALNAVSDALFYLQEETKDHKLGYPAGILCDVLPCVLSPELREHPFSERSLAAIRGNVEGFALVYRGGAMGGAELGLDDLVRDLDATGTDVDGQVETAIEASLTAVDTVPEPFVDALSTDLASVTAAYEAIRDLSNVLETQLLQVLELQIPAGAQGDSD